MTTVSAPRERLTGPDGRMYEYEPIKGQPGAFYVLYVHVCPVCKVEALSPTGAEGHMYACPLNPTPKTFSGAA